MKKKKHLNVMVFIFSVFLSLCLWVPVALKASDNITDSNVEYYGFLKDFDVAQKSYPVREQIKFRIIGQVGYIKIESFSVSTYQQVEKVTNYLKTAKIESLILDIRDNFGGDLYAGINTARLFVNKGVIATVFLNGQYPVVYYSTRDSIPFHTVVLVNALTASAAELFASAIQQSGAGQLVGVNTYGKSSIQRVTVTEEGSVNKETIGKYITRDNTDIAGTGITPDFVEINEYEPFSNIFGDGPKFKEKFIVGQIGPDVLKLEEELAALGYNPGNVDGLFTEETGTALGSTFLRNQISTTMVVVDKQMERGLTLLAALNVP